jgi:hypothetical protein
MINILSVKCSLAFAPYLTESISEFLGGAGTARSIRQGGSGFIIRSEVEPSNPGRMVLLHQDRKSTLDGEDLLHYQAAVRLRSEFYDVARTSDEVILATVNDALLLSHPQSEMWLSRTDLAFLVGQFRGQPVPESRLYSKPEWLNVSAGGGRLLISDQRTGRWVLLAPDQINELEKRAAALSEAGANPPRAYPPVILVKGIAVHLQSAIRLAAALELFADAGTVERFSEQAPGFRLTVAPGIEGMEITDRENRAALTRKESPKWAALTRARLLSLNAEEVLRGRIRTVFADADDGRWVLQWGDEVLLPTDYAFGDASFASDSEQLKDRHLISKRTDDYLIVLDRFNGNCIALESNELKYLASKKNAPAETGGG